MNPYLIFTMLALALFPSCLEQGNAKDDPTPTSPQSEIPTKLAGKWLWGTFSMTDFWRYDGRYQGNAFQTSVAFNFIKGGQCEFYYAASTTYYSCTTQAFTFKKGTVKFNDDHSFFFYPTEGNFRGFYGCAPGSNFNRKATASELTPETYYYSFEPDSYGKEHLVIRFSKNDTQGSYFKPATW
jgi:hypothetical protein